MDFALSGEQEAVRQAAVRIFADQLSDDRWAEMAASGDGFDRRLWAALAGGDLLGLAVPEKLGGSGLGFAELSILLEEAGRAAAPVPLWASLVLGGLAIDRFGTDRQRELYLRPLAAGELVLTAALVETDSAARDSLATAVPGGRGWAIEGATTCVPAGPVAGAFLVPARTDAGMTVFVVDARVEGLGIIPLATTTGIPEARVELDVSVGADSVLGRPGYGREIVEWLRLRATSGLCSLMAGTCRAALELTAGHAIGRKQFDRPIATFQAVGQRAADAYIDTQAVELTARQAAWRLAAGLPAAEQVAMAKFWAADAGQRVVHAAQHIHGGLGVDRSYPLHRYFLAAKQMELTLGGATASLLRLGALMAGDPADGETGPLDGL